MKQKENLHRQGFLGTQRYQKGTQSWYIEIHRLLHKAAGTLPLGS